MINFFRFDKVFKDRNIKQVLEDDGKIPMSRVIKILVLGPGKMYIQYVVVKIDFTIYNIKFVIVF